VSEDGFLSRWSRRKRAAEAGEPLAEPAAPQPASAQPASAQPAPAQAAGPAPAPEEPPFDLASLPSIESLTAESDFAAFLHKGVPAALRSAALRKAWSLDPVIRDFVGPADYAWDFNAPDGVPGFGLELPGDVQRMASRILGFDREERRDGAEPPDADAAAQAAHAAHAPDPPQPAAAAAPAPAGIEAAVVAGQPAQSDQEGPIAPAPRRHGSAMPT